jgi:hypothetical protein
MIITFTAEENQFLTNLLLNPDVTSPRPDTTTAQDLACELLADLTHDFAQSEVSFLQYLMQEQYEIWGRTSSTANEKQPLQPGSTFQAQRTLFLVNAIGIKLGASIPVDTTIHSDLHSPREEGSFSIMEDQSPGM